MSFLSSKEIEYFVDEYDMIINPRSEILWEDIQGFKYPLSFSGTVESLRFDEDGNIRTDQEQRGEHIEISPKEYMTLSTNERINLYDISSQSPYHVIGIVYLSNSFVRVGIHPYFQGIVDPGWAGGEGLHITLHNDNTDKSIVIDRGERICYISFCYVRSSTPLSEEYVRHISRPEVQAEEGTTWAIMQDWNERWNELADQYQDLEEDFQDLMDDVEFLMENYIEDEDPDP